MTHRFLICCLIFILGCNEKTRDAQPTGAAPRMETEESTGDKTAANHAGDENTAEEVDLIVLDHDGIQKLIAAKKGKIVVVDAWSTSCPPCVREFPNFVTFGKKYRDDVACISLSFDYEGLDTPEKIRGPVLDFLKSQKATMDNVLSSEPSDELYKKMELASVPAVFIYDREGNLVKRFDGSSGEEYGYDDVGKFVAEMIE